MLQEIRKRHNLIWVDLLWDIGFLCVGTSLVLWLESKVSYNVIYQPKISHFYFHSRNITSITIRPLTLWHKKANLALTMSAYTHLGQLWQQMARESKHLKRKTEGRTKHKRREKRGLERSNEREGLDSRDQLKQHCEQRSATFIWATHLVPTARYQCAGHDGKDTALCIRPTIWHHKKKAWNGEAPKSCPSHKTNTSYIE